MYRSLSTVDIPLHKCASVKIRLPINTARLILMMSWAITRSQHSNKSFYKCFKHHFFTELSWKPNACRSQIQISWTKPTGLNGFPFPGANPGGLQSRNLETLNANFAEKFSTREGSLPRTSKFTGLWRHESTCVTEIKERVLIKSSPV